MKLRLVILLIALSFLSSGCSAGMVNLDPAFQNIDNTLTDHEARLSTIENDYATFKSSMTAAMAAFNQTLFDFMPPGFVMCIISSTTAFNWEVKYGTTGVRVMEILP